MHRDMLLYMVRFHIRSNERILETTALVSDDEYRRPAPLDYQSAHETLLHVLVVDWGLARVPDRERRRRCVPRRLAVS